MEKRTPEDISSTALVVRDGRDELNLAEWPISVRGGRRGNQSGNTVAFSDTIRTKDGQQLRRCWTLIGSNKYGLPTPFCEDVYIALLFISRSQEFSSRTVQTSLRAIGRILGLAASGTNLKRIKQAISCLSVTSIEAEKSFWNKREQKYADVTFHIFEVVVFPEDILHRPSGQVKITWNEVFWSNIMAGNLKTLTMEFYNSLRGPIAKRLYRYLDKHRWDGKQQYRLGLSKLAVHLGLADGYPSQWKQRLQGAHDQLVAQNFLAKVEYVPGREEELAVYTFPEPQKKQEKDHQASLPLGKDYEPVVPLLEEKIQQIIDQLSNDEIEALQEEAWQQLSPAIRELTGGKQDHFAVQMEMRRLIRERFIDEKAD